jgi:hypothetical protein
LFPVEGTKTAGAVSLFLIGLEREERKSNLERHSSEASALSLID